MIYLDSAATSLLKPPEVYAAALDAMKNMASPGRGGHAPASRAADTAYKCRIIIAELFNVPEPEQVVFTMNATHGLNIAVSSLIGPGDRVVVSGYEHNAVMRPLHLINAETDIARSPLFEPEAAVEAFRKRIPGAKAVICNHVSNVFGYILPIYEIAAICKDYGVPLIIDASQSAGVLCVDFAKLGARFVAMPGHKGLMGPQGTGVLLCSGESRPLMAGGTGSNSRSPDMPDFLPDRLEAGTHNITGIAGLMAGVGYVRSVGPEKIAEHERKLLRLMSNGLSEVPGLSVYTSPREELQSGVLSIRHESLGCEEIGEALCAKGVAVRAGLHCAPAAHESAGTQSAGTVRFSFSPFNTQAEVKTAAALTKITIKAHIR
ncbi:MAG: aminotransferase class V-fold PLP-dependent enzyme [Clostridia bacterium]|nr:aminotransferase class V-fold PLP-dependent enzyme [Clostridia bacterium]